MKTVQNPIHPPKSYKTQRNEQQPNRVESLIMDERTTTSNHHQERPSSRKRRSSRSPPNPRLSGSSSKPQEEEQLRPPRTINSDDDHNSNLSDLTPQHKINRNTLPSDTLQSSPPTSTRTEISLLLNPLLSDEIAVSVPTDW